MIVTPYSVGCGALVSGIQLATLSDNELTELRAAFAEHGVLFFRDQDFPPAQHLEFAERFGSIVVNKFFKATSEFPKIAEVRKEKTQQTNIGGGWHSAIGVGPYGLFENVCKRIITKTLNLHICIYIYIYIYT